MIGSCKSGITKSRNDLWMTKEQWESIVLEMPDCPDVDPVMYDKYAKKAGMTYVTFWKWYQVWYGTGKSTELLPFIKTEAEIRERDKRRNRKKTKGVSDLPDLLRNRRKSGKRDGDSGTVS